MTSIKCRVIMACFSCFVLLIRVGKVIVLKLLGVVQLEKKSSTSIKCWVVIEPALREWREEIFVTEALRKQYCLSIHLLLFIYLGVS